MLPAWATVVLALGGSALTAVASVGVAYLTKKQESVAEWRTLLVNAAQEFSTSVGRGIRAVREALRCFKEEPDRRDPSGKPVGPHKKAVDDAIWIVGEASGQLDHLLLLFGQDTKTGQPAIKAVDLLRRASAELRAYFEAFEAGQHLSDDFERHLRSASGACTTAEQRHQEFTRNARNALPGRPYRFLGALRD